MKYPENDFVAVGLTPLTLEAAALAELERRLTGADRERAARFRRVEDRARFILGRALLARLLAERLGERPVALALSLTEQGRPYLPTRPETCFSISHAGDWVGVALAERAEVGIDIESLDRRVDLPALAERIFDQPDLARFRALPEVDQLHAFFRAWTGKEAVLKAKGVGLLGGVQKISVPLNDVPAEIQDPDDAERTWHVGPLPVAAGYVASLASSRFVAEATAHVWPLDELA
jgi:4'-phosphopantetheinyl transferase